LDVGYGLTTHSSTASLTKSIYDATPFLGEMARFSYYLSILGLITAIPAVISGGIELMGLLKRQDLAAKLQKSQNKAATVQKMHPKMKIAFAHAALMDASVAGTAYNWWTRSTAAQNAPATVNIYISGALLMTLLFSASLGGKLVYDHGVGVATVKSKAQ